MGTLAAQITTTGITAPSFADVLQQLNNLYWSIYGSDADLDPDTQDGQFLTMIAQAISDCNSTAIATYLAFSPATAQGVGLSSVVKINGIQRKTASNSTAIVTIGGTVGTEILNGIVGDNLNLQTQWMLPNSVVIPDAGTIDVTATCTQLGDIQLGPGALTNIVTPTLGWQNVTNADSTAPGTAVETDAQLRVRQTQSTALPSQTVLESIYASIDALAGVSQLMIYENDSDATDDNGIPGHTISAVVQGGDAFQIADAIALKKSPGTGTYGNISELVLDQNNVPVTIRFYQLTNVPLDVAVTIKALPGYTSVIGDAVKQNIADFINGLNIGENSYLARLYTPANAGGVGPGATFYVTVLEQSRDPAPPAAADVVIAFNEAATCTIDDVTLTVT